MRHTSSPQRRSVVIILALADATVDAEDTKGERGSLHVAKCSRSELAGRMRVEARC